jgi:hypothetical protein
MVSRKKSTTRPSKKGQSVVELLAPWTATTSGRFSRGNILAQSARLTHGLSYPANRIPDTTDPQVLRTFIEERSRVHETFIKEREKTRRIYISLATLLLIVACVIPVFAPEGR